jgi:RNA polymerase sigma factor (sigma-70 family)
VLTDAQLLEQFVARQEPAAFEELVRRHGPMVLRVCRRVLHHAQDAEDAFQGTFIVLARKAATVAKRGSLGSWLYGVAYRVALQTRERARHHQAVPLGPAEAELPDQRQGRPPSDVRQVIDEELNRLPEKYRAPLVLCFLEGRTNDEAAHQLGCSRGTIATRISRGRDRLRDGLVRRGMVVSSAALAAVLAENAVSAAVPASLTAPTVKAAAAIGAGKAVGGVVSAQASAAANAALKAMFWAKAKVCTATLAAAVALTAVPAYLMLRPGDPDLVAAYAFAEGKGTTTADTSPSQNHATLVGAVTWTAGRKPGTNALNFDGRTGYLKLDRDVAGTLGGTASVAFWIKTTQTGGDADASSPSIIGAEVAGNNDVEWGWLHSSGRIGIVAGDGTEAKPSEEKQPSAQSKQPINDGNWHHVAMTRSVATGEVRIYVDGAFQESARSGQGVKSCVLNEVGRIIDRNRSTYFFRGALQDVRFYRRVLTAQEVQTLAQP